MLNCKKKNERKASVLLLRDGGIFFNKKEKEMLVVKERGNGKEPSSEAKTGTSENERLIISS